MSGSMVLPEMIIPEVNQPMRRSICRTSSIRWIRMEMLGNQQNDHQNQPNHQNKPNHQNLPNDPNHLNQQKDQN